MQIVQQIDGRAALPVRTLPYVAGTSPEDMQSRLAPDQVALAAGHLEDYDGDRALHTFQVVDGEVMAVPPTQWGLCLRQMRALSARIKGDQLCHDDGHVRWSGEAIRLLPAGVFVWLDDFRAWFRRTRGSIITDDPVGVKDSDEITAHPLFTEEMQKVVLEGFPGAHKDELQQTPPASLLAPFLERSLRSAINEVMSSDRPWALLARERLGTVALQLDGAVAYGRKLIALLGERADRYDKRDPGEADRIRAAQGKILRALSTLELVSTTGSLSVVTTTLSRDENAPEEESEERQPMAVGFLAAGVDLPLYARAPELSAEAFVCVINAVEPSKWKDERSRLDINAKTVKSIQSALKQAECDIDSGVLEPRNSPAVWLKWGRRRTLHRARLNTLDGQVKHHPAWENFESEVRALEERRQELAGKKSAQPAEGHKGPRKVPSGGDSLTRLIWSICYDLHEMGSNPTAGPVMAQLKQRISMPGSPVVGDIAGGVQYENGSGNQVELSQEALRARIREWRKACLTPDS